MNDSNPTSPRRLRSGAGTELERRVLAAASREEPSRELRERMAAALGIAAPAPPLSQQPSPRSEVLATKSAAGLLPWASGAVLVLSLGAAVLFLRPGSRLAVSNSVASTAPSASPQIAERHGAPLPAASTGEPSSLDRNVTSAPALSAARSAPVVRGSAGADLSEQIRLIDAARAAVASGAGARALELVRQYQGRHASGSFSPEAAALKIEALTQVGRTSEARAQAEKFVRDHRGTALAKRVAQLTGISADAR